MELWLTILTGLAVWALLLVLAISLLLIMRVLRSIRQHLEKITFGVRAIEKETEMLAGIDNLNGRLSALAGRFDSTSTHFINLDRNLGAVSEALLGS